MTTLYSLGAITVAGYRIRTGDNTTAGTEVTGALVEAEELLEQELRRSLPLEERTKTFKILSTGYVYPDAWPITHSNLQVWGRALLGVVPDGGPFMGPWEPWGTWRQPRATVTWTGGFDATNLPVMLAHAIYDLARALTTTPELAAVAVGAGSISVGDVSVSYPTSSGVGIDAIVPGVSARVAKYRNRFL